MCVRTPLLLLLLARACLAQKPLHQGSLPDALPSGSASSWSVLLNDAGRAFLVPGKSPIAAAWGSFQDSIEETGWSILRVHTSEKLGGAQQSYAAGFLEGSLTHERMAQHRKNVWGLEFSEMEFPEPIREFLAKNMQWMQQEGQKHPSEPFWQMTVFMLDQLKGLTDGYNTARSRHHEAALQIDEVFMMSLIDADMGDLIPALEAQGHLMDRRKKSQRPRHHGHCSALIQCAPNNADLFVGHTTFDGYRAMLRVVKHLDMPLPGAVMRRIAFTSTPGNLYSADDFYVTDTGLAIQETSLENSNTSNWVHVKPESVMTWARAMAANRLAQTGAEWTETFVQHQSGTYNGQWMVVDYKRFFPGKPDLAPDTLWIVETMPGLARRADVTDVLARQGSWPSYNVPYFEDLWEISGYAHQWTLSQLWAKWNNNAETADLYSYTHAPRALMFKRANVENAVTSFASFMDFMRYNKANDPLEMGDRCNSIASRCDLNPPEQGDYDCFGGIDSKAVRWRRDLSDLSFFAVSGPSHGEAGSPFAWGSVNTSVESCKPSQHIGHPEVFDFDWYFLPGAMSADLVALDRSIAGAADPPQDAAFVFLLEMVLAGAVIAASACSVVSIGFYVQRKFSTEEDLPYYLAIGE